jgi:hypothetical protein
MKKNETQIQLLVKMYMEGWEEQCMPVILGTPEAETTGSKFEAISGKVGWRPYLEK